jgi:aldose 1-epimerase
MEIIELISAGGMTARVLDYGATLAGLHVPLEHENTLDVVLAYEDAGDYLEDKTYLGSTVGRYSNRIAGAAFELDDQCYRLAANEGPNTLHGGPDGFDKRYWQVARCDFSEVTLTLESPDGDQGFPGTLQVEASYRLLPSNTLEIEYLATTDKPTVVSLANHSYFNLAGWGEVLDHSLQIDSGCVTALDAEQVPTGELLSVLHSPFDFRSARRIRSNLAIEHPQLADIGGLDHNWLLDNNGELRPVAHLYCPDSRLRLSLATTQPALQVYTGNHLAAGGRFPHHGGICLETQHCPNAPNLPHLPSPVLLPGQTYRQVTRFSFDQPVS